MEISQVKIFPVREEKLKAFVSIVLDQCFMINDIKIIQGKDGLFLSMPSRRKKNGEFKDVAHPLNNETRRLLEECVLAEYRQVVDDSTPRRPDHHEPADAGAKRSPVAVAGSGAVSSPTQETVRPAAPDATDQTLEEVEELHLRDSFWTVS